jgi:phosphatidylglycerophosphatase A
MTTSPLSRWHPAVIWSTWFWSGLFPKAPGTMGSLAALPVGFVIHYYFGPFVLGAATLLVFFSGWWSSHIYVRKTGRIDPGEIVIDEVAGLWIALLFTGGNLVLCGAAFLFFRLFDIWKPWPINWLDQNVTGAFGVMIDDILAGIYAAVVVLLLALLPFIQID